MKTMFGFVAAPDRGGSAHDNRKRPKETTVEQAKVLMSFGVDEGFMITTLGSSTV
jgi:hypothetical protein